jgi:hypothetical protein
VEESVYGAVQTDSLHKADGVFNAVSLPCHEYVVLKATSQGYGRGTAWDRHGVCELVSAVQRRRVGDMPAFSTVGEWQGSGRVLVESWQGRGRGTAWERHGMCESADRVGGCVVPTVHLGILEKNKSLPSVRL